VGLEETADVDGLEEAGCGAARRRVEVVRGEWRWHREMEAVWAVEAEL
jgi:hypothetical protein